MATAPNVVKFKRSAVAGKIPQTTDLNLGELALNTYDGVLYFKKSPSGVDSIVALQPIGTGSGLVVGDTSATLNNPTLNNAVFEQTFSIGTQVFYPHTNGFSVNENFDITDPSQDPANQANFTGYHFASGADKAGTAFTLARSSYFTDGFGVTGDASNNQFVIGSETYNTDFVFKNGIGMPFDVSGGTTIFSINRDGSLTFADTSVQTTAWLGSVNQLVNGTNTLKLNSDGSVQFPNYTFPAADGTAGQILQTDGAGNISWVNKSSTQTASTTQLGVVKIDGTTITINNGVISVASDNTDLGPLFALNTAVTGANTYDTGLIFRQGSNPNVGLIYSISGNEFRTISTIESGTTQGTVAVASYKNIATASVKITSESANKVTFTDSNKVVRSLDNGRTAYVDGLLQFNSDAELALPAGSTSQRPSTPQTGSVRFNSDKMMFEGYANATWQALGIGTGSAPTYQGFVGDGITYQFTLASAPLSAAQLMVTINGVLQEPGYSYQVSGTTLSFIGSDNVHYPPELNDRIDIRTLSAPSVSSIQEYNYIGDGSTTTFASQYLIGSVAEVLVFVNNIYQDSAVYTVNGYNVVFSQAPFNNERVTLVHLAAMMSGAVVSPSDAFFWGLVGA
jgi:hypothetical protein